MAALRGITGLYKRLATRISTTKKRGTHARQMPYYLLITQLIIWFVESKCLAC